MVAIFQMAFSNILSWMKMYEFQLKVHWSLFPRVQLTIFQHWFRQWLGADKATSHCVNQWWVVYWCTFASLGLSELKSFFTHWGRVTHICVIKLTIIGSDNGLSPGRRQAIIWTNAGILLIGPIGTNFSEILIGIQTFSFKKMHLKMSSAKLRPFCLSQASKSHLKHSIQWQDPIQSPVTFRMNMKINKE